MAAPHAVPPTDSPIMGARFLTVAEVATVGRVSKMTIYRLCNSGELESKRVGRAFRIPEQAAADYFGIDLQALEAARGGR